MSNSSEKTNQSGAAGKETMDEILKDISSILTTDSFLIEVEPGTIGENFGLKDSSVYRKKLMSLFDKENLKPKEKFVVIALFTWVKNRNRVLKEIGRFSKLGWYEPVKRFIENHITQYVSTIVESQPDLFPAVNIPNCAPSIAAVAFLFKCPNCSNATFMNNLWFSQMNVPNEMKQIQKVWEQDFWDKTVQKTNNIPASKDTASSYQKGFHEQYWLTKSADKYPFMNLEGGIFEVNSASDLSNYIKITSTILMDCNTNEDHTSKEIEEEKASNFSVSNIVQDEVAVRPAAAPVAPPAAPDLE